ncbi:hypothetical protein [Psychrobacter sp. JCM 18900]|uniref:hypothetical protein n=1 Tax=Psychrobacter sp. JCM 18900 TaxID=1298608 RepID=UPI0021C4226F|nr:hypothetical protein [Psychrobacter sp. JCM 18900]
MTGMLLILSLIIIVLLEFSGYLSNIKVGAQDIIFWVFIGFVYLAVAYDQIKEREALKAVIKILLQSEKTPNLISINDNWKGKDFLKRLGFKFKSLDEINFEQ